MDSYFKAMQHSFLDELQEVAMARTKTAGAVDALKNFAMGAKAGAHGMVHLVKSVVKPGASAIQRGIVAGAAGGPAAAGTALGVGATLAATRKNRPRRGRNPRGNA
jgi:hypothetical protein